MYKLQALEETNQLRTEESLCVPIIRRTVVFHVVRTIATDAYGMTQNQRKTDGMSREWKAFLCGLLTGAFGMVLYVYYSIPI